VISIPSFAQTLKMDTLSFYNKRAKPLSLLLSRSALPLALITSGEFLASENSKFRSLRNQYTPTFNYKFDNYFQYSPAALLLSLKVAGVEGRSTWGRMLVSDAFATALMASTVNLLKQNVHETRPDGSSNNSFPSGHTATAFMCATMLHYEYGLTRSPWYSIAGYTLATTTGIARNLNNRHWLSDVLVGAGIGVLSTDIAYFIAHLLFKDKGLLRENKDYDAVSKETNPSFFSYYIGINLVDNDIKGYPDYNIQCGLGRSVGIESAYFFTKHIGLGAKFNICTMPLTIKKKGETAYYNHLHFEASESASMSLLLGPFYSIPVSNHFFIGFNSLVGISFFNGGSIKTRKLNEDKTLSLTDFFIAHSSISLDGNLGTSFTYQVNKTIGVRSFIDCDYVFRKPTLDFKDTAAYSPSANKPISRYTFGVAMNILF